MLFRNTANLSLKGTTYDATHMDKFLRSDYGDRSPTVVEKYHFQEGKRITSGGTHLGSTMAVSVANNGSIKPSVSFMNLSREE